MGQAQIVVQGLAKTYQVPERQPGLAAAIGTLFHRSYRAVTAVQDVNFVLEAGEMVALLGSNGAGKTTTLKMLAGLLRPSAGTAMVAGYIPWERNFAYLRTISMVLGNKSQVSWDIPPADSFRVLAEIYNLPHQAFQQTLDELVALLDLEPQLNKPARNLSLGERMKCELVAGLLHRPRVLFLDEPTLGLDVSMQRRLRQFLAEYNRQHGVTILLTSHYMADVVALCRRVILIHEGRLLFDGALTTLAERLAPFKLIRVTLGQSNGAPHRWPAGADVIEQAEDRLTLRVQRESAPLLTAELLQTLPVVDLAVEDPPIEAVIDQIYSGGAI